MERLGEKICPEFLKFLLPLDVGIECFREITHACMHASMSTHEQVFMNIK